MKGVSRRFLLVMVLSTARSTFGDYATNKQQIGEEEFAEPSPPSCQKGFYLNLSSNTCIPCTRGQNYMNVDHNRESSCIPCSSCLPLMEKILPCEESHDIVCRCVIGYTITVEGLCTKSHIETKETVPSTAASMTVNAVTPQSLKATGFAETERSVLTMTGASLIIDEAPAVAVTAHQEIYQRATLSLLIVISLFLLTLIVLIGSRYFKKICRRGASNQLDTHSAASDYYGLSFGTPKPLLSDGYAIGEPASDSTSVTQAAAIHRSPRSTRSKLTSTRRTIERSSMDNILPYPVPSDEVIQWMQRLDGSATRQTSLVVDQQSFPPEVHEEESTLMLKTIESIYEFVPGELE